MKLPLVIWRVICSFLTPRDVLQLRTFSKIFLSFDSFNALWRDFYENEFGNASEVIQISDESKSRVGSLWFHLFAERYVARYVLSAISSRLHFRGTISFLLREGCEWCDMSNDCLFGVDSTGGFVTAKEISGSPAVETMCPSFRLSSHEKKTCAVHSEEYKLCAYATSTGRIVVASARGLMEVMSPRRGNGVSLIKFVSSTEYFGRSCTEKKPLLVCCCHSVLVLDPSNGDVIATFGNKDSLLSPCIFCFFRVSESVMFLISGNSNGMLYVWDTSNCTILQTLYCSASSPVERLNVRRKELRVNVKGISECNVWKFDIESLRFLSVRCSFRGEMEGSLKNRVLLREMFQSYVKCSSLCDGNRTVRSRSKDDWVVDEIEKCLKSFGLLSIRHITDTMRDKIAAVEFKSSFDRIAKTILFHGISHSHQVVSLMSVLRELSELDDVFLALEETIESYLTTIMDSGDGGVVVGAAYFVSVLNRYEMHPIFDHLSERSMNHCILHLKGLVDEGKCKPINYRNSFLFLSTCGVHLRRFPDACSVLLEPLVSKGCTSHIGYAFIKEAFYSLRSTTGLISKTFAFEELMEKNNDEEEIMEKVNYCVNVGQEMLKVIQGSRGLGLDRILSQACVSKRSQPAVRMKADKGRKTRDFNAREKSPRPRSKSSRKARKADGYSDMRKVTRKDNSLIINGDTASIELFKGLLKLSISATCDKHFPDVATRILCLPEVPQSHEPFFASLDLPWNPVKSFVRLRRKVRRCFSLRFISGNRHTVAPVQTCSLVGSDESCQVHRGRTASVVFGSVGVEFLRQCLNSLGICRNCCVDASLVLGKINFYDVPDDLCAGVATSSALSDILGNMRTGDSSKPHLNFDTSIYCEKSNVLLSGLGKWEGGSCASYCVVRVIDRQEMKSFSFVLTGTANGIKCTGYQPRHKTLLSSWMMSGTSSVDAQLRVNLHGPVCLSASLEGNHIVMESSDGVDDGLSDFVKDFLISNLHILDRYRLGGEDCANLVISPENDRFFIETSRLIEEKSYTLEGKEIVLILSKVTEEVECTRDTIIEVKFRHKSLPFMSGIDSELGDVCLNVVQDFSELREMYLIFSCI